VLRAELEREALMAYAAHAAGANIPEALVTRLLDPLLPFWQVPLGVPSRMRMPGRSGLTPDEPAVVGPRSRARSSMRAV